MCLHCLLHRYSSFVEYFCLRVLGLALQPSLSYVATPFLPFVLLALVFKLILLVTLLPVVSPRSLGSVEPIDYGGQCEAER